MNGDVSMLADVCVVKKKDQKDIGRTLSSHRTDTWVLQLATYQPLIKNSQSWINPDGNHSQERAVLQANPSWLSKEEKTL